MLLAIPPDEPDRAQHTNENQRKHDGVSDNFPPVLVTYLIPSKPSHTVLPLYSAGSLNSVRYLQDCRNGLAGGIGRVEKSSYIGYVVPGMERRLSPGT